jgi:hypothetical protein
MGYLRLCGLTTLIFAACTLQGSVIVTRSDHGYQFADAVSIRVNGKDKVLTMGSQPKPAGPINKLPNTHLSGTVVKDADAGVLGLYSEGTLEYLLPEGLQKAGPSDPREIWKGATISYKKTEKDKTSTDVPVSAFVAFLPGGTEELARVCRDDRELELIGGKGKEFATEIEFMAALVHAYPNDAAIAKLARFVEQSLRQRYETFERGTAGLDTLREGLKLAELSEAVYPDKPEHQKLRTALRERKAWLDRKVAVLRAFAAAKEWDAFLLGDRDFETYQHSYPEMVKLHTQALNTSLQLHRQSGKERVSENEFGAAWRELRTASSRQPSDKVLQQDVLMAWTDYSRQVAIDRQGKQKQLTAGQREAIKQALLFATNYKAANKLDEALRSVKEAEAIDAESLPVLLKKAEVLGAQHDFNRAMAALDSYDLRAVNEERDPASKLRGELLYQRTSMLEDVKSQFQKAWTDGSFHRAYALAQEGLRAKEDDAELLYGEGLAALILRNPAEGRGYFKRYLEAANTLDANSEQRVRVRGLMSSVVDRNAAETGSPNWFSGKKLPAGVYYCPVSLAFQPQVDRIEASGKMRVTFDWSGNQLRSITPAFEKNERATGERKISFAYGEKLPQVATVAYDDGARAPDAKDPDAFVKQSSVILQNNPYVDPVAVQQFTGKTMAIGIAGNKYFEPFVWDKIHYFQLTYDEQGRVSEAREVASPGAAPGDFRLALDWDGQQLDSITAYQGKIKVYERELQYQDDRLVGEEIRAQGKTSRIKYVYNGGRLVSASCDRDATQDDRSRQVFFR